LLLVRVLYEEAVNSLERLKQHRQNAKAFYKSGKIWRNDLLQAEVRVSRGEQDVFAAKNQLVLAKSKVNLILNRDIYGPLNPLGKLEYMNFDGELQQYLDLAKSNRLEIKQGIIDIKMAGKDKEIAKAKSKPSVELKLSSSFSSLDLDYEDHNQQTTAALNLRWNFWQFGQTNREVHAANAKLRAKRLQLEQTKADITLEVQSAFLAVKESQYSLKVSEQALQQSLENFRVSQIRYKEQLGSSNDVLDAQDLLTQTRTDRFSALSRYLTALAQLDLAVGRATSF